MFFDPGKEAQELTEWLQTLRRRIHRCPETAFQEFETTALVARELEQLGYEVYTGESVCGRAGTGAVGILRCGMGPVLALRFDLDALPIQESGAPSHGPQAQGFASGRPGVMHACGHDGHTAVGLGCARLLAAHRKQLSGTVKLIFQPAEEGCRGAQEIVARGWLDDADLFLAGHVEDQSCLEGESAAVIAGVTSSLATTKLDAEFFGTPAHGAKPEEGSSANLALATAVLNLSAIPRHSAGASFVNVGTIRAGRGRNVVSDYGKLELEVRGETTKINRYMETYARRILEQSARMHGCICRVTVAGSAPSLESSQGLCERLQAVFSRELPGFMAQGKRTWTFGASEDAAHMLERVKARGGQGAFLLFPTRLAAPLHRESFDFDETVMVHAVRAFCAIVLNYSCFCP